jgi:PhoH-like protein
MGELFEGMGSKNIPLISYVTRRMVTGYKNEFTNKIAAELGVRLTAKKNDVPLIGIKGEADKIELAEGIILGLDQKAKIIADRNGLKTTGDIHKEHWDHLRVDLNKFLEQARDALSRGITIIPDFMAVSAILSEPTNDNVDPNRYSAQAIQHTIQAGTAFEKVAKESEAAPKIKKRVQLKNNAEFEPYNLNQAITYMASLDTIPAEQEGGRRRFVNSYIYAGGPAGGGKTYSALKAGVDAYAQGLVDEIIIIRPPTTAGKDPGAMPGDKNKKGEPYLTGGIASNLEKITGMAMRELQDKKVIRPILPDWERGETYGTKSSPVFVYIDEPQNLTVQQAELLITRLAEGSIMVWGGDIGGKQTDLKNQLPGFVHLIATQGEGKIDDIVLNRATAFIQFTKADSKARNSILPHVLNALESPSEKYASLMKEYYEAGQNPRLTGLMEQMRLHAVEILGRTAEMTRKDYEKRVKKAFPFLYGQIIEGQVLDDPKVRVLHPAGRHP